MTSSRQKLASILLLLAASSPFATGCTDDGGGDPDVDPGPGGAGGGTTGGAGNEGGMGGQPHTGGHGGQGGTGGHGGAPPVECAAPTRGPTIHPASAIESDEVWTADGSPHIVEGFIAIREATLTIEPCAVVQFKDEYAGLTVAYPGSPTTGHLVAEGTAEEPILFEGLEGARWGHLLIEAGGTARFAHVSMTGGGGYDPRGATMIVQGSGEHPTKRDVYAEDLTVADSRGAGIVLDRLAGFADGSSNLVITRSGSSDTSPYPLITDEHGIDTLPRGQYTGNAINAIHVNPTSHLGESTTMKNLGVPYAVGTFPGDHFVVGAGSGTALVKLTIEPGTRIEMHPGTGFKAEHYTGPFPASGVIVAEGTAEAPIVFTSGAEEPAPGDWRGLWFGGIARGENSFKHVRLEYTGAWCGCVLTGCSDIERYEGAIIFSQEPARAFFEDTVIADGAGHGVVLGYLGGFVDVADGVEFEGIDGCEQTLPTPGSCPNPLPACQ